jgi:hypothetical protein
LPSDFLLQRSRILRYVSTIMHLTISCNCIPTEGGKAMVKATRVAGKRSAMVTKRATVMKMREAGKEEGNGKGGRINGNGEEEGNGQEVCG